MDDAAGTARAAKRAGKSSGVINRVLTSDLAKKAANRADDLLGNIRRLLNPPKSKPALVSGIWDDASDTGFFTRYYDDLVKKKTTVLNESGVKIHKAEIVGGSGDVVDGAEDLGGIIKKGNGGTKIKPSNPYDSDAIPDGSKTKITERMDEATIRSLARENDAAEVLAKNGYRIEQNPKVKDTTRNPDYRIEGEIFDCYAPAGNTKVRNVASTIEEKVVKKGQANRVVLNLDDWLGDIELLKKQLMDYPIVGLEEVLVIKDGNVVSIYP